MRCFNSANACWMFVHTWYIFRQAWQHFKHSFPFGWSSKWGGGGQNSLTDPVSPDFPQIDDDKEEEITEYTYKTYDELINDLKITKNEISETDLTGLGSEDDPYVVHSTRGFLYLGSYTQNKINLYNKYVVLNCDINLNDETFDENGKPSGGDGIVYATMMDFSGSGATIIGNNHKICGIYYLDETKDYVSFFPRGWLVAKVKNVIFENVYLLGNNNVSLFYKVEELENCVAKNGNVFGIDTVAAFCQEVLNITNCINYLNVTALNENGKDIGGIAVRILANGKIVKTKNYGNITGASYTGGLVAATGYKHASFEECYNYGKISGIKYSGGIISAVARGDVNIRNCGNYGDVINKEYTCGGLMSFCYGDVFVYDFVNDAAIVAKNIAGGFIGIIECLEKDLIPKVTIKNSKCFLNGKLSKCSALFGSLARQNYVNLQNINCFIVENESNVISNLINSISADSGLVMQNISVIIKSNISIDFYCVDNISNMNSIGNVFLHNIYIKVNFDASLIKPLSYNPNNYDCIKSIIVESSVKDSKFYGTNFSGFYFSWKTGKIGLIALDGRGTFQGTIDEEWLIKKGYEKREI